MAKLTLRDIAGKLKDKLQTGFGVNDGKPFVQSPVGQSFANFNRNASQAYTKNILQPIANAPRFEFARKPIENKVLSFGRDVALGIPESFVNIPRNLAVGAARLEIEKNKALMERQRPNLKNIASGIAPIAEAGLDFASFGVGSNIAKQGAKQLIKGGIKQAAKKGAISGGLYGATGGLTYGLDRQYGKDFSGKQLLGDVTTGAALGGILGGGLAGGGAFFEQVINGVKKLNPKLSQKQAQEIATAYLRDKAGRFAKQAVGYKGVMPDRVPYEPIPLTQVADNKMVPSKYAGLYKNLDKNLNIPENFDIKRIKLGLGVKEVTPETRAKVKAAQTGLSVPSTKGVVTPEELARQNFNKVWQEKYGNRPATVKTETVLDQQNASRALQQEKSAYIQSKVGEPKSYSQKDINTYNQQVKIAIKEFEKLKSLPTKGVESGLYDKIGKPKNLEELSFIDSKGNLVGGGGLFAHDKIPQSMGLTKNDLLNQGNIRAVYTEIKPRQATNALGQDVSSKGVKSVFLEIREQITPEQLGAIESKLGSYPITVDITDNVGNIVKSAKDLNISQFKKFVTKGVESMPVNPKGSLDIQRVVDPKTGKILSTPQTGGEISTRTMANQAVSSTPIITEKGKLNLNRLKIKGAAKQVAQDIEAGVTPTVIGNKEVIAKARTAKGTSAMTDEQMKNLMAQQLKNRQVVVDLSKKFNQAKKSGADEVELGKIMLEIADQSRTARQGGTFAGRLLQAQNIVADKSASPMQKIIALLDNAGVEESKYLKDSVKVNWDNPREVVAFYRKYVPPKLGEVLDEIRYSNMLSSPLTHITNISSNALQTGVVAPIEKTISGVLDLGKSLLTGKERKYYTTAGIDYSVGYTKSLPQAFKKAWNVISGNEISVRPDFEYVPTGVGGPLQAYTTPLRALEAMDQFFKTLVEGGVNRELARGPRKMSIPTRAGLAEKEATYRLFRQSFDPNGELGQGVVLQMFDKWNNAISGLRRLPGGKWILPFFQTPTNILKQGVEYSPLGISTAIGAKNPIEQLSKAIIGSTVMMGAYQLASSGLTSWEAPSGEKERELYYAAGMQPYSVKIGDKWVSYSKLGPLSYPIAMAAALAHSEKYNPDKSKVENISKAVGGMLQFFGDQSYVRNIGDLVDAIQGGVNVGPRAISSQAANLVGQLIPYKSFMTWLGRMIDPTYRKATTFKDRLVKDIPVLGSGLEPYTDINGKPSMRDLPFLNAVSPLRVTQEKSQMKGMLDEYQTKKIQKAVDKRADDKFADSAKTGEGEVSGNVYRYIDDNGSVKTIDLSFPMPEYKPTGNSILDKELLSDYRGAITKRKNEVMKAWEVGAIDQNEAIKQLETLVTASNKTKSPKKPKKITLKVSSYKAPKITIKKRSTKLPTIKFKKPKKIKIVRKYTIK